MLIFGHSTVSERKKKAEEAECELVFIRGNAVY